MSRLGPQVLEQEPDVVVILLGTNDIRVDNQKVHVPREKFRSNLTTMVTSCQKTGAKVVLCTLPPIDSKPYFERHNKKIYEKNGGLASLVADYRTIAIEVAKANNATPCRARLRFGLSLIHI